MSLSGEVVEDSKYDQEMSARYHDQEAHAGLPESSTSTLHHDDSCPLIHGHQRDDNEKAEDVSYRQHRRKNANRARLTKAIALAFSALGWLAFLISSSHYPTSPTSTPANPLRLDTTYQPPADADFDIVINMYREDPSAVATTISQIFASNNLTTNHRIYIYNKNEDADLASLSSIFPTAQIMRRPNIGREGETYLHHILSHWDHLAKHTLFMQATPDDIPEFLRRITTNFVPSTGMLFLGFVGAACDCALCSDPYWHDYSGLLAKTYALANNGTPCNWLMLSYKGQFIASAARIRGAGPPVYEYLSEALTKEHGWAHQPSYWQPMGLGNSMNSPALGFSVERLWGAVMQCSDLRLAERCPTLISLRGAEGVGDDCQCRDFGPGVDFVGS